MKAWLLVIIMLGGSSTCPAQTSGELDHCQRVMDKDIDVRLAPTICATINKHLARGEKLVRVSHDGDFTTILRGHTEEKWMPGRLQSTVFLETMRMYYKELEILARRPPQTSIYATPEETDFILNLWPTARDGFCRYHPGEAYLELSNLEAVCPASAHVRGIGRDNGKGFTGTNDAQSSLGLCNAPVTLEEARKAGGRSYECRLFSYPNF